MTETYTFPDGVTRTYPYAEIFAVDPVTLNWVQVTDIGRASDGDNIVLGTDEKAMAWSNDGQDSFLSIQCMTVNGAGGNSSPTAGLAVINVSAAAMLAQTEPISSASGNVFLVTDAPLRSGNWGQHHDWPRHNQSVFLELYAPDFAPAFSGLFEQSVLGGQPAPLVAGGWNVSCSRTADRMACNVNVNLVVLDYDGGNLVTVATANRSVPIWSPDGSQLSARAELVSTVKGKTVTKHTLVRMLPVANSGYVDLTPGLDQSLEKYPLGWRD